MFFETLKLKNGHLYNLTYHQERVNSTLDAHFSDGKKINLQDLIAFTSEYPEGLYKVRVDYGLTISKVSIEPYEIKTHRRLKILEVRSFEYSFKYAERSFFASTLDENPGYDDILFTKNGLITDTTYCNIALFDGSQWITPGTFLLPGTKRKQLLLDKKIIERNITAEDLSSYKQICFINAMRDFEKTYCFVINQNEILLTENEP
jgi:4-amino-4-deoxychorismate lyase